MPDNPSTSGSVAHALFRDEPAGAFQSGHVFRFAPDLNAAREDPSSGYWHCDIVGGDRLTWSDKVYELFGLPPGTPIERNWAVERYEETSRDALDRVRNFGLNHKFGFILDAEIRPEEGASRWIRVMAVPIMSGGRVVGLHGLKRAL